LAQARALLRDKLAQKTKRGNAMTLSNLQAADIASLIHPFTNLTALGQTGPNIMARGKGVFVYDSDGKEYLEAMSSLWCVALGWGEEELVEAATEQMRRLAFVHIFAGKSHDPAIALAEKLKEIAPFPVGKVFFANSGSEANDSQLKFRWYAANARGLPARTIISRQGGYHGTTLATTSLTGMELIQHGFDAPLPFARHVSAPHYYRGALPGESESAFVTRLAAELEALILAEGPQTIAAMITEPVQAAGGAIIPPDGYFPAIMAVLDRHGIGMIDDEVVCGFGRTGNWFGCQTYGYQPDSMSLAKGLSSAYIPISAVLLSPELSDIVESEARRIGMLGHGFTYTGHPVAAAVALKTIEIYQRRDIVGHVRRVAPVFAARLKKLMDNPLVDDAKSVGLIGGLELVADRKTKARFAEDAKVAAICGRFCMDEGLVVRPLAGDRMAICPPLIITEAEINELFDRFERGLGKTLDWALREGLI
jgi:4-aminobutyrate--pyruvate transaminase